MRPVYMTGAMSIPTELVDVREIKRALKIKHQPMGEEKPQIIEAFSLSDDGYIHVPRQYGIQLCRTYGLDWEDRTSPGHEVEWPKIATPREYQVDFIDSVSEAIEDYYDFLARAHTGFGKTISSLIAAARKGITTLIVVDQENLRDQWIEALTNLFGFALEDIGIIQGTRCTYAGKAVTIGMVQTLSQKEFAPKVYEYFGLVIVDEVHIIGAPTFSRILMKIPASFRFGVSATPKRRDGLQKLLDFNLGRVRVAADKEHEESVVYFAYSDRVYSWYANISPKVGRFINEVAEDGERNLLIAESALWLYETGRDVLVLSDRIEHLTHLMNLCTYLGIPEDEMGVYAGTTPVFRYAKDPKPGRRPFGVAKHEDGKLYYTPISLQLISKTTPKRRLEEIKDKCRIIFATYGMFAKGVDVPRLAGGIDATPRGTAEQIHGRILREVVGKLKSIWITICDRNNFRAVHSFANRAHEYEKSNGRIFEWHADGGIEEWDAHDLVREMRDRTKHLKSLEIRPSPDGGGHFIESKADAARRELAETQVRIQSKKSGTPSSATKVRTRSATKAGLGRSTTNERVRPKS